MEPLRPPGPSEVHLFYGDPADLAAPEAASQARTLLTGDERERIERYRFERDRLVSLATRVLVRRVLSRYHGVLPAAWRFEATAHGRPFVAGDAPRVSFNLANTHGLVVCAVAASDDVGVDVERIDRKAPLEIVDRYFAPSEVAALRALPEAERPRRFFDLWTLKESYIKARGLGLAIPLDGFAFHLRAGAPPRITIEPRLSDDANRWRFAQRRPGEDHLVAVCRGQGGVEGAWEVEVIERRQPLAGE